MQLLAIVSKMISQMELTKNDNVYKGDLELVVREMVKTCEVLQTRFVQVLPWN